MKVEFVKRENGPERLVCEAEVYFGEDGPLKSMKLVGFSVWRGPDGEVYVTFPSRAFGSGGERKFFDYIRPVDGANGPAAKAVKAWIKDQYEAWAQDAAPEPEEWQGEREANSEHGVRSSAICPACAHVFFGDACEECDGIPVAWRDQYDGTEDQADHLARRTRRTR